MKFDLIDTELNRGPRWAVHIHGCKDVAKSKRPWTVEAETPEEVVKRELDMDNEQYRRDGWSEKDFKIMPCVKRPPVVP